MNRREMLKTTAALGLSAFPLGWVRADDTPKRKLLFYTKSSGFQHSVVARENPDELSYAEKIMTEWGTKNNFEVTCTKDGTIFTPEKIATFDAFMFYTTGDLTKPAGNRKNNKKGADGKPLPAAEQDLWDKTPPMSPEGKQALLDAIKAGKGFVGSHCGSDTFHSKKNKDAPDTLDPYIEMVGGEFIVHGAQQKTKMTSVDDKFPGMAAAKDGFEMMEEWYALKNHAKNLHVLLVQETKGMNGWMYARPPFPATWAREHDKGRVFFTSMGHREDVWKNPVFESILLGGLSWAFGNVKADVTPNLDKVTPEYATLGQEPPPKEKK